MTFSKFSNSYYFILYFFILIIINALSFILVDKFLKILTKNPISYLFLLVQNVVLFLCPHVYSF